MQLRSGRNYSMTIVQSKPKVTETQYKTFRQKCGNFILELNDSTRQCVTIFIMYKLYCYIDSELDNVNSYLNLHSGIKSFIDNLSNNIPRHIHDIISCELYEDMGATWNELTGFNTIEIARMLYELRAKLREMTYAL